MKNALRTLALSSALVAFTMGVALAQEGSSTPAATPAPAKTETKAAAKPAAAKAEKTAKTSKMAAPKWNADQIKAAQTGLTKGGYYKGQATGKWNKATTAALKAWQKANKMKADGKLTEEILTKLQAS